MNGGTCNNLVDSFTCDCAPGYDGNTCDSGKLKSKSKYLVVGEENL